MTIFRALKYVAAGFGVQVVFVTLFALMGLGKVSETVYEPWFLAGEWALPSGPGGHAMPGGAMLGWLVGIVCYSVVIGTALYYVIRAFSESEAPDIGRN